MIDRLSILALKLYHMSEQSDRIDVDEQHRQRCIIKAEQIQRQQAQLHICLTELCTAIQQKTRTFCVYHQFKMYNDPTLNPELYRQTGATIASSNDC